jgi:hypothetical protein
MAKNSVETAIRNAASSKVAGKFNLPQYKKEGTAHYEERQKALLHKRICEEIVAFADSHKDIPFYFILQVGVYKGAFKMSEFEKGYKQFKAYKVEQVHMMGMEYNKYNGLEGKKMSDVTIRLVMRYYEKVSSDFVTFINDLNKSEKLGKQCGARGNYEALCKNLNIPVKETEDEPIADAA